MSKVFSLKSSSEFIVPIDDRTVEVFRYEDDIKLIGLKYYFRNSWEWDPRVYVGRGKEYGAIEVFGTVIAGGELEQLAKDLKAVEEDPNLYTFVNRLGLCVITEKDYSFDVILINYHFFGWPNYAVESPQGITMWWDIPDTDDEPLKMDVRRMISDLMEANEELRHSLKEANVELTACKKELEETNLELAACKKEAEWSKKMESLFNKLVEKPKRRRWKW
ncbi:unnamed protein product [Linum trigynum]|uniref:Uncharacterized protein n=1 Tax=Linum trigynum TaxID=586398 RepID=A0AAV2DGF9_9ROSI